MANGPLLEEIQTSLDKLAIDNNIQEVVKADEFLDIIKKEITDSLDDFDDQTVAEVSPGSAESGDDVEVHEEPLKFSPDDLYIFYDSQNNSLKKST